MVCVGGASVMKSGSGESESVVEDDWSEGREDGLEERGVAGGERLVAALVLCRCFRGNVATNRRISSKLRAS